MSALFHRGRMPWSDRPPEDELTQAGLAAIGRDLRELRHRRRLSQRDLQVLSGVHQTVISRIENGRQHGVRWSRYARMIGALTSEEVRRCR